MADRSDDGGGRGFRLRWTLAVRDDPRLPSATKHLALALATFMDAGGYCHPGVATLAAAMSVDPRTVQRQLRDDAPLRELGYLTISRGGGRSNTHGYQATLPDTAAESRPFERGKGGSVALKGDTGALKGGTVPPELVRTRQRTRQLSVCSPDDESSGGRASGDDPLGELVDDLRSGRDRDTERVWRERYAHLTDDQIERAHDALASKRAEGTIGTTEAAYTTGVLRMIDYVDNRTPPREAHG